MLDTIFSTAINYFGVLISLFPEANVDIVTQINEFMSSFRGAMSLMGVFFPVPVLMWAMGVILVVETAVFTFKMWRWIASNVSFGIFK